MRKRFTFILEYAGGTYLAQIIARDLSDAFKHWYDHLTQNAIPENGTEIANGFLRSAVDEGGAIQITGLHGVWCATALVRNRSAMVHIVASTISRTTRRQSKHDLER